MDDATLACFHVKEIQQDDALEAVTFRPGRVSPNGRGHVLELNGHLVQPYDRWTAALTIGDGYIILEGLTPHA